MAAPSFFEEKRGGIEPRLGRNITCPFVVRKAALTCWFSAPGSAVHSLHPAFTSWAWPCVFRVLPAFLTNAGTMSASGVRREKAALSSGCKSHPATAPAGSNRSRHGGDEMSEAFG